MVRRRNRDVTRVLTGLACVFLLYFLYPHMKTFLSSSLNHSKEWRENHRGTGRPRELNDVEMVVKAMAVTNGAVPVFIVEEHHEVLGYWFISAEHGIIPKKKNVLLHIDGHGDGAPPVLIDDFPLFSWPKSTAAILAMMQRNDVFIMAAGLTGLVHRYIWVWPMWDGENHRDEGSHSVWKAELGTMISGVEGPSILCGCWQSVDDPEESGCQQQNPTSATDGAFLSISRSQCRLRMTATVEFVSEEKALELLKGGEWITSEESVILDVDEDFYGCESAASPLYKFMLHQDLLNRITDLVSFLFCAQDTEDEKTADLFYYAIIEMILKMKLPCQSKDGDGTAAKDCVADRDIDAVMIQLLHDLHKTLMEQHSGRSLCDENKMAQMLNLQSIVRTLVPLNVSQLMQLAETGICLRTSPRGLDFNAEEGMMVCQGSNLPNSTAVFFHSPTPHEVKMRTAGLGQIFAALKKSAGPPALVTIARSMRDGYTPRSYFHRIETDLLQLLRETFSDMDHTTLIHFDSLLLGGKGGWSHRHKRSQYLPGRRRRKPREKVM